MDFIKTVTFVSIVRAQFPAISRHALGIDGTSLPAFVADRSTDRIYAIFRDFGVCVALVHFSICAFRVRLCANSVTEIDADRLAMSRRDRGRCPMGCWTSAFCDDDWFGFLCCVGSGELWCGINHCGFRRHWWSNVLKSWMCGFFRIVIFVLPILYALWDTIFLIRSVVLVFFLVKRRLLQSWMLKSSFINVTWLHPSTDRVICCLTSVYRCLIKSISWNLYIFIIITIMIIIIQKKNNHTP